MAFNGVFDVGICDDKEVILNWTNGNLFTKLDVKLSPFSATVSYNGFGDMEIKTIYL